MGVEKRLGMLRLYEPPVRVNLRLWVVLSGSFM